MPYYRLCINIPQKVLQKLEEIERKGIMKKEDLVLRAIIKILEQESSE